MSMTPTEAQTPPFSLAELRFYLTRAGVGAGAPFGVAEDFAEAVVFVSRLGFDPSGLAAAALTALATETSASSISYRDGVFSASDGGPLSSVFMGGILCDRLNIQVKPEAIVIKNVESPLLVAAYLCSMPNGLNSVGWGENTVVVQDGRAVSIGGPDILTTDCVDPHVHVDARQPETVTYDQKALNDAFDKPLNEGVRLDKTCWETIYTYFHRYLVPSTAEERATAAGAGLVDTD